jgi:hypothetical protein
MMLNLASGQDSA